MPRAIILDSKDNVATLIDNGLGGEGVSLIGADAAHVSLTADVPYGHKCAIKAIPAGGDIVKYGQVVGLATAAIAVGDHVHVHNVESRRARGDTKGSA